MRKYPSSIQEIQVYIHTYNELHRNKLREKKPKVLFSLLDYSELRCRFVLLARYIIGISRFYCQTYRNTTLISHKTEFFF